MPDNPADCKMTLYHALVVSSLLEQIFIGVEHPAIILLKLKIIYLLKCPHHAPESTFISLQIRYIPQKASGITILILKQCKLQIMPRNRTVSIMLQFLPQKCRMIRLFKQHFDIIFKSFVYEIPKALNIIAAHPLHLPIDINNIVINGISIIVQHNFRQPETTGQGSVKLFKLLKFPSLKQWQRRLRTGIFSAMFQQCGDI